MGSWGGGGVVCVCGWRQGSQAPRGALSSLWSPFLPALLTLPALCKPLRGNQGHDPPLNLPSNWEGQLYP